MDGKYTIPTLIFLSPTQRAKLERLIELEGLDLSELLSDLLVRYLDEQPEPPLPAPPLAGPPLVDELRRRRADLRRLRARMARSDGPPAPWLAQYLADLEGEIAELERRQRDAGA